MDMAKSAAFKCNALGIDAYKNLRDGLHVQIGVQIDEAEGLWWIP